MVERGRVGVECGRMEIAHIRDYSYLGRMVAIMQGGYYQEAMGVKNLNI